MEARFRKNAPSPIRDTVHNYIRTTKLETHVVDSPEFQRLRDILQNSTAYQTFPCNTNTRFAHSLGVMHVAGKMFVAALKNSSAETLEKFISESRSLISFYGGIVKGGSRGKKEDLEHKWLELVGNACRFSHNPDLFPPSHIAMCDEEDLSVLFIINTLWQVVRLGALVHDFGHLPMSHIFENSIDSTLEFLEESREEKDSNPTIFESCIQDKEVEFESRLDAHVREIRGHPFQDLYDKEVKAKVERKYHENLGLYLFSSMYNGEGYGDYPALVKKITIKVLATAPHAVYLDDKSDVSETAQGESARLSLLSFFHSIFDNDFVDADRIDYCMRDPASSGSELGAFDHERVIDSCTLVVQDNVFRIAHNYKSIGAIESFLYQRNTIYTSIIYHHSILRMNALLERIIRDLIVYFNTRNANVGDKIIDVMLAFKFFEVPDKSPPRFLDEQHVKQYDESWFKTLLRAISVECEGVLAGRGRSRVEYNLDNIKNLKLMIDTFLERKVESLMSVWKSSADFQRQLNLTSEEFGKFNRSLGEKSVVQQKYKIFLRDMQAYFRDKDVLLLAYKIRLPAFSNNPLFIRRNCEVTEGDSVPLRSLSDMAKSLPTVNYFLVGEGIKDESRKDEISGYIDEIRTKFSGFVMQVIEGDG